MSECISFAGIIRVLKHTFTQSSILFHAAPPPVVPEKCAGREKIRPASTARPGTRVSRAKALDFPRRFPYISPLGAVPRLAGARHPRRKDSAVAAWLKVLVKMIPWTDVVKAAPSVLSVARDALGKRGEAAVNTDRITPGTPPEEAFDLVREDISLLRTLVAGLEAESDRKSRLIAALTDENARLADAVIELRRRFLVALLAALLALAGAGAAVWMALR